MGCRPGMPYRRGLTVLNVETPCPRSFGSLRGDGPVRYCPTCDEHVYDLSAMSAAEAREQIRLHEGELCLRFVRRADGTVVTADCADARSAAERARAWNVAGAVAVAVLGVAVASTALGSEPPRAGIRPAAPAPAADHEDYLNVMGGLRLEPSAPGTSWVDPEDLLPDAPRGSGAGWQSLRGRSDR